jgi:hypothetical protein
MPLIEAVAVTIVAAVSVSLAGFIIMVIVGIRHEERVFSMTQRVAPGLAARLARLVVMPQVRNPAPRQVREDDLAELSSPASRR